MERLSKNLCLEIFRLMDCTSLAAAAHESGGDWHLTMNCGSNSFKKRWGSDCAASYAPRGSKSWKDVYEAHDRCELLDLDLKLKRKSGDYYVIRGDYIHKYVPSGEGAKLPPGFGDRKMIDSAFLVEDE
ncbi:FBOX [Musa troglodytarum]|uniref:FBOX n=1 Tax=Musa troglodytarum TaxID=320322 RepID=A0A9E7F0Z2_9LILI|nr:FBOX [Musa troglodytarum]